MVKMDSISELMEHIKSDETEVVFVGNTLMYEIAKRIAKEEPEKEAIR